MPSRELVESVVSTRPASGEPLARVDLVDRDGDRAASIVRGDDALVDASHAESFGDQARPSDCRSAAVSTRVAARAS